MILKDLRGFLLVGLIRGVENIFVILNIGLFLYFSCWLDISSICMILSVKH